MTDNARTFSVSPIAPQPPHGEGFSILDSLGSSVASFVFASRAEAEEARNLIATAIAKAIDIHGHDAALATTIIPIDKLDASNDE